MSFQNSMAAPPPPPAVPPPSSQHAFSYSKMGVDEYPSYPSSSRKRHEEDYYKEKSSFHYSNDSDNAEDVILNHQKRNGHSRFTLEKPMDRKNGEAKYWE
jgi:hypothetical protein